MEMSIEVIAADIVARLRAITELKTVGFTVGSQEMDPYNRDIPHPSAWVIYTGDDLVDEGGDLNHCSIFIKYNFVVKVIDDWDTDENALLTQRLPLLHTIATAINGNTAMTGSNWLYEGQGLEELDGRMVWAQSYSIKVSLR